MNTYTPEQSAEIDTKYNAIMAKAYADVVIEVNWHSDESTMLTVGDANISVLHKITIDREPRTEWQYSSGQDHEVTTGIDYEASVDVSYVSVVFETLVLGKVELPVEVMSRVIECIAKHSEELAEENEDKSNEDYYESLIGD